MISFNRVVNGSKELMPLLPDEIKRIVEKPGTQLDDKASYSVRFEVTKIKDD